MRKYPDHRDGGKGRSIVQSFRKLLHPRYLAQWRSVDGRRQQQLQVSEMDDAQSGSRYYDEIIITSKPYMFI